MTEPRIVPPEEARSFLRGVMPGGGPNLTVDLLHTATVLGEQREAVLALHQPILEGHLPVCVEDGFDYPCPTASALGVTE